jgi:hypothetical protein
MAYSEKETFLPLKLHSKSITISICKYAFFGFNVVLLYRTGLVELSTSICVNWNVTDSRFN